MVTNAGRGGRSDSLEVLPGRYRLALVVRDLGSMLGTFVNGLNVTTAMLMSA